MNADAMTGTGPDILELLVSQHREVEQLWSELQTTGDGRLHEELARKIVALLSQHDALEAQLLYPELRARAGEAGRRLSGHSLDEHRHVRQLLSEVDGADLSDQQVRSTLAQCMTAVAHHVQEEEGRLFPLLRRHCDAARLQELGRQLVQMQQVAPTHPHPHTPDSKAGATVAGAVAGLVDRARDALRAAGRR